MLRIPVGNMVLLTTHSPTITTWRLERQVFRVFSFRNVDEITCCGHQLENPSVL